MVTSDELSLPSIYFLHNIPVSEKVSLGSLKDESVGVIVTLRQNLEIFTRRASWVCSTRKHEPVEL